MKNAEDGRQIKDAMSILRLDCLTLSFSLWQMAEKVCEDEILISVVVTASLQPLSTQAWCWEAVTSYHQISSSILSSTLDRHVWSRVTCVGVCLWTLQVSHTAVGRPTSNSDETCEEVAATTWL